MERCSKFYDEDILKNEISGRSLGSLEKKRSFIKESYSAQEVFLKQGFCVLYFLKETKML